MPKLRCYSQLLDSFYCFLCVDSSYFMSILQYFLNGTMLFIFSLSFISCHFLYILQFFISWFKTMFQWVFFSKGKNGKEQKIQFFFLFRPFLNFLCYSIKGQHFWLICVCIINMIFNLPRIRISKMPPFMSLSLFKNVQKKKNTCYQKQLTDFNVKSIFRVYMPFLNLPHAKNNSLNLHNTEK